MNTIELTDRPDFIFRNEELYQEPKASEFARFSEWNVDSLVDLIVNAYHVSARKNVAFIYELAQNVYCKHGEKHPELSRLIEALFLFFDDLLFHLKKEEQILFPNILQLTEKKLHEGTFDYSTFGVIREYAVAMQNEHREIMREFSFFRQLTSDYLLPEDACDLYRLLFEKMKEFEADMIMHMKIENQFLFPKAIQMDNVDRKREWNA